MMLRKLIDNLDGQLQFHRVMLDVLVEEVALPTSCQVSELEALHAKRDRALDEIKALEMARLRIIETYANENGLTGDHSLKSIIATSDSETGAKLQSQRDQLMELVTRIKEVGQKNAERAILRKNCITEVQQALHKGFKRTSVYSMYGKIQQPKGSFTLQRRV